MKNILDNLDEEMYIHDRQLGNPNRQVRFFNAWFFKIERGKHVTEKRFYLVGTLVALCGLVVNHAAAEDAARGWSSSMGYRSPSEHSVLLSQAQAELMARKGLLGTQITNNDNSTTTTTCETAGACQNGTNVNGYSETNVNGEGNIVTVDVDTDGTSQTNATSTAEDIGTIGFN